MKHNSLFGIAAVISSIALLIHSFQPAQAIPTGPSVNMGSNPIENIYGSTYITSGSYNDIFVNTTNNDLIVRTAMLSPYYCQLAMDNQTIFEVGTYIFHNDPPYTDSSVASPFLRGTAAFKVPVGSSLQVRTSNNNTCQYYVEAYYVHP